MPRFFRRKFTFFISVFLSVSGVFLFSLASQAAWDANAYSKPYNGTLTATEWNNLLLDFPPVWLPATFKGPVTIGTSTATTLTVNGTINATNFSGAYTGTIGAQNVSSGAFGSNTGGGNYTFPAWVGIGVSSPSSPLTVGTTFETGGSYTVMSKGTVSQFFGNELYLADQRYSVTSSNVSSYTNLFKPGDYTATVAVGQVGTVEILGSWSSTSAVSSRSIFIIPHWTQDVRVKIEIKRSDDTWATAYDNTVSFVARQIKLFSFYSVAPYPSAWPIKGIRFTFSDHTSLLYLNQLGLTNPQGENVTPYLPMQGGNVYGATNLAITSGNVGIGTTNPIAKLAISGGDLAIDNNKSIIVNSNASTTLLLGNYSGGGAFGYGTSTPYTASLAVEGDVKANRLCIQEDCKAAWSDIVAAGGGGQWTTTGSNIYNANSGNVGIGKTNPTYKLDVIGDSSFDGSIIHSSNSYTKWETVTLTNDTVRYLQFNQDAPISGSLVGYGGQVKLTFYNIDQGESQGGELSKIYHFYWYNGAWSVNQSQVINAFGSEANLIRLGEAELNSNKLRIPIYAGNGFGSGRTYRVKIEVMAGGSAMSFYKDYSITGSSAAAFPGASYNQIQNRLGIGLGSDVMPNDRLDVAGAIRLTANTTFSSGAGPRIYKDANLGFAIQAATGTTADLSIFTPTGIRLLDIPTGTNNLILQPSNSGNVGIGTTNPGSAKLAIYGSSYMIDLNGSNTSGWVRFMEGGNTRGYLGYGDGGSLFTGASTDSLSLRAEGDLHLGGTGNNLAMTIKSGNVGIGSTTPVAKLAVSGGTGNVIYTGGGQIAGLNSTPLNSDHAVPLGYLQANYTPSGTAPGGVGAGTSGQTLRHDGTSWVANSTLFNNGTNVGIGTTAPNTQLTIRANGSSPQIHLADTQDGGGMYIGAVNEWAGVVPTDEAVISVGARFAYSGGVITSWTADTTNAQIIRSEGGAFFFYGDTGLTAGNTFTPTPRLVINSSGNVGVGTTTPQQRLDVGGGLIIRPSGTTDTISFLSLGSSQSRLVSTNNFAIHTGGGEAMRFMSDGKVGIGSTTPVAKLAVSGGTGNVIYAGGGQIAGLNSTPTNSDHAVPLGYLQSNYAPIGTGAGSAFVQGGNSFGTTATLGTNDNNLLNIETNNAVRMTVASNGNVGIGITNPTKKFAVSGDTYISGKLAIGASDRTDIGDLHVTSASTTGATIPLIRLETTTNSDTPFIRFQAKNSAGNNQYADFIFNPDSGNLSFKNPYSSAERLVINSTGNVGIGTTAPNDVLEVSKTGNGYISITDTTAGSTAAPSYMGLNFRGSNSNIRASIEGIDRASSVVYGGLRFNVRDSGGVIQERMRIEGNGNVGVGLTNPTNKFQVSGGTGNVIYVGGGQVAGLNSTPINSDHAVPLGYLQANYTPSGTAPGGVGAGTSGQTLRHDGTSWVANSTLFNNGTNVGIGVTNPQYAKLELLGNMRIQGQIEGVGGLILDTNNSSQIAFEVNNSEKMRLNTGGDLLINTTTSIDSNTEKLAIKYVYPETGVSLQSDSVNNHYAATFRNPNGLIGAFLTSGNNFRMQALNASGALDFLTNGSSRLYINETGNIGIGTIAPADKLHVYEGGAGQFSGLIIQKAGATTGDEARIDFAMTSVAPTDSAPAGARIGVIRQGANALSDMYFSTNNSSGVITERMRIANTGNIGIGTTTPVAKLAVSGGTGNVIYAGGGQIAGLNSTPVNSDQAVPLGYLQANYTPSGTASGGVGNGTSGQTLRHDGTSWVANSVIFNNGTNVGIGTTNPVAKLHVNGGVVMKRTPVADTNYTVLADDYIIGYTSITANRTVTLPNALCTPGRFFVVVDESGNASASAKIIIDPEGTTPIIGLQTLPLEDSFNSVYVFCGNSAWYIL